MAPSCCLISRHSCSLDRGGRAGEWRTHCEHKKPQQESSRSARLRGGPRCRYPDEKQTGWFVTAVSTSLQETGGGGQFCLRTELTWFNFGQMTTRYLHQDTEDVMIGYKNVPTLLFVGSKTSEGPKMQNHLTGQQDH